ncbi:DUF6538 domain-containing protein [Sinorhizobium sp. CCBAU 05631]|uniref:DUF6538 domain-containing protein n=1 Tax=Sinorhizobium sp. CCBAU 05631 TaxID=794846 RepID=UPI00055CE4BA|nr:DUF6538 domain-containing protein [Sinorhizobium sp. CCBAU 05631]
MPRTRAPNYLEQMNNGGWRVSVPVPRDLIKVMGKTRLKRSLDTHSHAEAAKRKHAVVAEFLQMIEAARVGRVSHTATEGASVSASTKQDLTSLALDLRSVLQSHDEGTEQHELEKEGIYQVAEQIRGAEIDYDAGTDSPVFDPHKEAKAGDFLRIALGMETPLNEPLELFHSQVKWNARTKSDSTRAMKALENWCHDHRVSFTVEAITRKRAGRFIGDLASSTERPLTNRTINKYLSCLSKYWKWLEVRGYIEEGTSPWSGQSLPKEEPKEDEKERPFTETEISTLLTGEPNQPYLKAVMLIGALTGARIDAIISLKRKDITDDGNIRFKAQKREKASRLVPIHPDLVETLKALTNGKEPDDDLFPECPPVPGGKAQERSMPAVKAFGYYREKRGVSEKVEGKRRGLVNFHSFRRWFITKAYQANQPEIVVQIVVGQKPQSVAAKVYLGGLTQEQLRACVEAVKLPN